MTLRIISTPPVERAPGELPVDAFTTEFTAACQRAIGYFRQGDPGRARYEISRAAHRCAYTLTSTPWAP